MISEKFQLNGAVVGTSITETIEFLKSEPRPICSPYEIIQYERSGLMGGNYSVQILLSVGFLLHSPGINEIAAYINRVAEEILKREIASSQEVFANADL